MNLHHEFTMITINTRLSTLCICQVQELRTSNLQPLQLLHQIRPLVCNLGTLLCQLAADPSTIFSINPKICIKLLEDVALYSPDKFGIDGERYIVSETFVSNWTTFMSKKKSLNFLKIQQRLPWKYALTSAIITRAGSILSEGNNLGNSSGLTPDMPTSANPLIILAMPVDCEVLEVPKADPGLTLALYVRIALIISIRSYLSRVPL